MSHNSFGAIIKWRHLVSAKFTQPPFRPAPSAVVVFTSTSPLCAWGSHRPQTLCHLTPKSSYSLMLALLPLLNPRMLESFTVNRDFGLAISTPLHPKLAWVLIGSCIRPCVYSHNLSLYFLLWHVIVPLQASFADSTLDDADEAATDDSFVPSGRKPKRSSRVTATPSTAKRRQLYRQVWFTLSNWRSKRFVPARSSRKSILRFSYREPKGNVAPQAFTPPMDLETSPMTPKTIVKRQLRSRSRKNWRQVQILQNLYAISPINILIVEKLTPIHV